jgi:hypothetical protein
MTDRYNFLTVALEKDIRSDDAESLIIAIKQLRGVLEVKPNVSNGSDMVAEIRARDALSNKLWDILNPATP